MNKISFASDYEEGAHPAIIKNLERTNFFKSSGYGTDEFSESAREKIRKACNSSDSEIYFLVGGTQTNAVVISAILKSYEGVIAPDSGHISVHEAGAIELGGHKVLTLKNHDGKISADDVKNFVENFFADGNHEHMVFPGMVYISQPTEYGTLYTLDEIKDLNKICREKNLKFYVDGARLAYALASEKNSVTLENLAELCDAFYIGGTKCGAYFGEAVVLKKNFIPHFFTIIKQRGALLAKGRILGVQFDTLFTDDLYFKIGRRAINSAEKIRNELKNLGFEIFIDAPTNQIFVVLSDAQLKIFSERVAFSFWEKISADKTVIRLATSWATQDDEVEKLLGKLRRLK